MGGIGGLRRQAPVMTRNDDPSGEYGPIWTDAKDDLPEERDDD